MVAFAEPKSPPPPELNALVVVDEPKSPPETGAAGLDPNNPVSEFGWEPPKILPELEDGFTKKIK